MYKLTNFGSVIRLSDNAGIPEDKENTDYQNYLQWLADGNIPAPADQPNIEDVVISAVQRRMDEFAMTRGYDNVLSACTYATSKIPKFSKEATYCVNARDDTWAQCYAIMNDVLSGARPMPTVDEVLAELPVLEWPN